MNATVKSTVIALAFVATLSRFAPVQAQARVRPVLSKSPVVMQSRSLVNRLRPVSMRLRPVNLRIRPVLMQRVSNMHLSSRRHTLSVKRVVAL
jgi:hypothetical protein